MKSTEESDQVGSNSMRKAKQMKLVGTILAAAFAVVTVIGLLAGGQADRLLLAVGTVFLAAVPMVLEKLLRCRISLPVYLAALLYAVGPMLGHCWYFYYTVPWWDKLLHICGGVMFAVLGAFLFEKLTRGEQQIAAGALFALCFSVAVAVLWEFAEFGADCFFGMDMQDDTVVTSITSYLLGESVGVTGSIADITSVAVNGIPLPIDGYLDIGLIDSMLDMLLESLGALITCLLLALDKGKHPLIRGENAEGKDIGAGGQKGNC